MNLGEDAGRFDVVALRFAGREERFRASGYLAIEAGGSRRAGQRAVPRHEHAAPGGGGTADEGGHGERRISRKKRPHLARHVQRVFGCDRLNEDVDRSVTAQAESPHGAVVVAGLVVAEPGHPLAHHGHGSLAHVRFEASTAHAPSSGAALFHEQLGAGTPIRGSVDPHDGRHRRALAGRRQLGNPAHDMRRFLPVFHVGSVAAGQPALILHWRDHAEQDET